MIPLQLSKKLFFASPFLIQSPHQATAALLSVLSSPAGPRISKLGQHWDMTLSLCFAHLLPCLQHSCAVDYSGHAAKQGPFRTKMPLPTKPAHEFWLYTGSQGQNLDWTGSTCIGAFVSFFFFLLVLLFLSAEHWDQQLSKQSK